MTAPYTITLFDIDRHAQPVAELWEEAFGYQAAHQEPQRVIAQKEREDDGLFFVAETDEVIGTVMSGYDGHRGWIYSLAVRSSHRRQGVGRALVKHAERALAERGCLKINLQIMTDNAAVEAFYHKLGYATEERISMGKRLLETPTVEGDA